MLIAFYEEISPLLHNSFIGVFFFLLLQIIAIGSRGPCAHPTCIHVYSTTHTFVRANHVLAAMSDQDSRSPNRVHMPPPILLCRIHLTNSLPRYTHPYIPLADAPKPTPPKFLLPPPTRAPVNASNPFPGKRGVVRCPIPFACLIPWNKACVFAYLICFDYELLVWGVRALHGHAVRRGGLTSAHIRW
jgi:hypothetical protein